MGTGRCNAINIDDLANGKTVRVIEVGASFREERLPTIEQMLKDLTIGGGITIAQVANKSISKLTDDELTQLFVTVPMHSKLPFLEEMKRRNITSFVLDLGEELTEEKIMESMESFALLAGDPVEQLDEHSYGLVIVDPKGMATDDLKEFTQCRKYGTPKPNTFYKSLNAKHNKRLR